MARIRIDINTESNEALSQDGGLMLISSANQVGLLSSVTIANDMMAWFNLGLGSTPQKQDGAGYKGQGIINKKELLRGGGCKVIAAVGGSVVQSALSNELAVKMPPFVAVVGKVPATLGNGQCRGGVSLESVASNSARKNYLVSLGYTNANIYLYTNRNSAIHSDEKTAWLASGGSNTTFLESYVGDGTGNNDPTQFAVDFNGGGGKPAIIPASQSAIIISDDPFFQTNQAILVPLFNTWLSTAGRQVVYPSQRYTGLTGNSTIIGPDLTKAYMILGALSASLLANQAATFGFVKLASEKF
jgi:hypothetical protein